MSKEPPTTSPLAADEATATAIASIRPSSIRVLESRARSAGDVLLRSKVPASRRTAIANEITALSERFGELTREAWGGEG